MPSLPVPCHSARAVLVNDAIGVSSDCDVRASQPRREGRATLPVVAETSQLPSRLTSRAAGEFAAAVRDCDIVKRLLALGCGGRWLSADQPAPMSGARPVASSAAGGLGPTRWKHARRIVARGAPSRAARTRGSSGVSCMISRKMPGVTSANGLTTTCGLARPALDGERDAEDALAARAGQHRARAAESGASTLLRPESGT